MNIDLSELLFHQLDLQPGECRGKTVLVTGAGRGIGLQTARCFGLLGARVILAEISVETGQAAQALLRSEGSQATFIPTDISQPESVQALASFGLVDILINNAIRCPVATVTEMDLATWDAVIAVNLRGTFLTCKAFLPGMLARKSGVIVNMVSTDAMPGLSAYIASKQGIDGFSRSLAQEVTGSGVSVVPFAPGMVDTPAIRAAASGLSPLLGITEEQFLGLSLHPSYSGLMPPEHAGAATTYLALRLANEYHGQPVNGYEVLERAGLLQSVSSPDLAMRSTPAATPPTADISDLRDNLHHLSLILAETGQEFEHLPLFARPLARSGFKSKAGTSLGDWQRLVSAAEQRLRQGSPLEISDLPARLEKLIIYYQGVPAETARFTRDQALLDQVAATTKERIDCIRRVLAEIQVQRT